MAKSPVYDARGAGKVAVVVILDLLGHGTVQYDHDFVEIMKVLGPVVEKVVVGQEGFPVEITVPGRKCDGIDVIIAPVTAAELVSELPRNQDLQKMPVFDVRVYCIKYGIDLASGHRSSA